MSKLYKLMNNGPDHARQVRSQTHVRPDRDVDMTSLSPLVRPPDIATWRIAMTEPRREQEAVHMLAEAGYIGWYPQETIIKHNAAKRERATVNVPLFARYVFVGLTPHAKRAIKDCKRVSHLLPYLASPALVSELYRRQSGGEFRSDAPVHAIGDNVTVTVGAFSELNGIVTRANHDRVEVLVSIFGSDRTVSVDAENVRGKAA